jgi:hypothetical protein
MSDSNRRPTIPTTAAYAALEDACPACRSLDGWSIPYADLATTPRMHAPNPGCTHPEGCRCVVLYLDPGEE